LRAEDQYRAGDKKDVLEYTSERQNKAGAGAHEEDGRDVEAKGKGGIGKEYERANACKLEQRREAFCERKDGEIDEGTDGRVIVERDKWVHLETV